MVEDPPEQGGKEKHLMKRIKRSNHLNKMMDGAAMEQVEQQGEASPQEAQAMHDKHGQLWL